MGEQDTCILVVVGKLFEKCTTLFENLCVHYILERWTVSHESKRFGDQLRRGQLFKDFSSF